MTDLRRQMEDLKEQVRKSGLAEGEVENRQKRLRALEPEILLSGTSTALEQWRRANGNTDQIVDGFAVKAAKQAAEAKKARAMSERSALEECAGSLSRWTSLIAMRQASEKRLGEIQLPTTEAVTANEVAYNTAQAELRRIDSQMGDLEAPLQRLRSEGWQLLEHLSAEHRCPLCAHDYETGSALRAAVKSSLEAVPLAMQALAAQKAAHATALAEAKERKSLWEAASAEAFHLVGKIKRTPSRN